MAVIALLQMHAYTDEATYRAKAEQTLELLANQGQLAAYRHDNFWQCMDTLRDKHLLENLWNQGKAPWKSWTWFWRTAPRSAWCSRT